MDDQTLTTTLHQFIGTEQWYRHGINRNMLYTDGIKFFADHAGGGAYWFLDIMATELMEIQTRDDEPFIAIHMRVNDNKATITADDGNGKELWKRAIEWTDCPHGNWEFYLISGTLLLTSEY